MYRYLFFDLDGTLSDSSEGIFHCLRYSLEKMKVPPLPYETERLFIGPPLPESYAAYCGFDEAQISRAVSYFRESYLSQGRNEVSGIDGIHEALKQLQEAGYILAVTSSKEHPACLETLDKLDLTKYFTVVCGSPSDLARNTKELVIRKAMEQLGLTAADTNDILMVGDRKYDVAGAAAVGISCLGVTFCGFAPEGELEEAGAVAVVSSPAEMVRYILNH